MVSMQEIVDAADTLKRGRIAKRPVNSRRKYYELASRYQERLDARRAELALDAAVAAYAGRKADLDRVVKQQDATARHAAFLGPAVTKGEDAVTEHAAARKADAAELAKLADEVAAGKVADARLLQERRAAAWATTDARAVYQFHVRVAPPRKKS